MTKTYTNQIRCPSIPWKQHLNNRVFHVDGYPYDKAIDDGKSPALCKMDWTDSDMSLWLRRTDILKD